MSGLETLGVAGEETSFGRSIDLWRAMPVSELMFDPGRGYGVMERFVNAPTFASATPQSGQQTYQDSSVTIRGLAVVGGGLRFATPATDNMEAHHQLGGLTGSAFTISDAAFRDLAHEQCFRVNQLAETAMFVGLGEEGMAVADALVDNTGALVSKDFIGFHCPAHASVAKFSAVYRKAGSAMVTVAADVHTAVAADVVKMGFYFEKATKKLFYYVNGVVVATLAYGDWSNFPDAELLSPIRGLKSGEASAKTFDLFWADTFAMR